MTRNDGLSEGGCVFAAREESEHETNHLYNSIQGASSARGHIAECSEGHDDRHELYHYHDCECCGPECDPSAGGGWPCGVRIGSHPHWGVRVRGDLRGSGWL